MVSTPLLQADVVLNLRMATYFSRCMVLFMNCSRVEQEKLNQSNKLQVKISLCGGR